MNARELSEALMRLALDRMLDRTGGRPRRGPPRRPDAGAVPVAPPRRPTLSGGAAANVEP